MHVYMHIYQSACARACVCICVCVVPCVWYVCVCVCQCVCTRICARASVYVYFCFVACCVFVGYLVQVSEKRDVVEVTRFRLLGGWRKEKSLGISN